MEEEVPILSPGDEQDRYRSKSLLGRLTHKVSETAVLTANFVRSVSRRRAFSHQPEPKEEEEDTPAREAPEKPATKGRDGQHRYVSISPDEVALVEAAASLTEVGRAD